MRRILIYGDSISTENHGHGGYVEALKLAGFTVFNQAVAASGITNGTPNSLQNLLEESNNYIIGITDIIIWHGTNDWYYHVPKFEFEEAIHKTLLYLKYKYPSASITFLTPLIRCQSPNQYVKSNVDAYTFKNDVGLTLKNYKESIIKVCFDHCVYLLEMDRLTFFSNDTFELFFEDMIHPNKNGYQVISSIIIEHLHNI